jgi:hypothetical protein
MQCNSCGYPLKLYPMESRCSRCGHHTVYEEIACIVCNPLRGRNTDSLCYQHTKGLRFQLRAALHNTLYDSKEVILMSRMSGGRVRFTSRRPS